MDSRPFLELMFRKTPRNIGKLKAVARELDAIILRPYYPVSGLFRWSRDLVLGGCKLWVVGKSKCTPRRAHDKAVLDTLSRPSMKLERVTRSESLAALKKESELARLDLIRKLLSLPMDQRTHFLRKRVGFRASCL